MKTIESNYTNEIIIKNSRFVTCIFKINDSDISKYLDLVKNIYPKATHYCYGYIYNEFKHFSDDGEPSGTAGRPIMNVLEKRNLNKVLVIVIRYFGGIKLGAGGLVRAYTKSVTNALDQIKLISLEKGYLLKLTFSYDLEKQINYLLKNIEISMKEYNEKITYIFECDIETFELIKNYQPLILKETYIEKNS